jgi:hypothetical protein
MVAVITGADFLPFDPLDGRVRLCFDLGLLKTGGDGNHRYLPANPIYRGIIVTTLISNFIMAIPSCDILRRYLEGEIIDMNVILEAFQLFSE